MDSSTAFGYLPPPPDPNPNPNPNSRIFPAYPQQHTSTAATTLPTQNSDINARLSTLKHLIHLSKTTIHSLSNILPTTATNANSNANATNANATATATCPYNSNHRVPPTSLFRHHLQCPSSTSPIDLSFLESLHYTNSLHSPITTRKNNYSTQTLANDENTDLCVSLADYHTSLDSNFFYCDCPAVVTFPHDVINNNNADRMLSLPAVLSAECADSTGDGNNNGITDAIDVVKLLPSEYYDVRTEISHWNDYDYPSFYSGGVVRSIVCCYLYQKECLMEWMLVNSPYYGVVIDVFMRDHILVLFRLCLKAIAREAVGYLVLISKES